MGGKGFTTTELIVTVGIIAVVSLMAFPVISAKMPEIRMSSTIRLLAQQMQLAKLKSISQNKEHRLVFTNNAYPIPDSYRLERNDGVWKVVSPEVMLPADVNITKVTFPLSRCEFNPNGTTSAGGVCFDLAMTGRKIYKITTTTSLGKVNIRDKCPDG